MANITKKISVSGVQYAAAQHTLLANTVGRQQLAMNSAQQNYQPDVSARRKYHAPPRQIKDVLYTPNFVRGKFDFETSNAYPSHGWNVGYDMRDPVTGGKVQRRHAPTGGEGEML